MEGAGALVSGLGGASPNPVDGTATDLPENSSEFGNGSAQLSVDDLASGSHDPAVLGTSPNAATALPHKMTPMISNIRGGAGLSLLRLHSIMRSRQCVDSALSVVERNKRLSTTAFSLVAPVCVLGT